MAEIQKIVAGGAEYGIDAQKFVTPTPINGVKYDGSSGIIHYAVCETESTATEKEVSVPGFSRGIGAELLVKFSHANRAENPTLNVNGTGAMPIYQNGATPAKSGAWADGETLAFVYDGTGWQTLFGEDISALAQKTVTDTTVVITDGADGIPVRELTVNIFPTQDEDGEPAPDNILPITGVSELTLTHGNGTNIQIPYEYSFGEIIYGGILDVLTGILTVNKIGRVFTGEEDEWDRVGADDSRLFRYRDYRAITATDQSAVRRGCSHFPNATIVVTGGNTNFGYTAYTPSGADYVRLDFRPDLTEYDTVDKWKAYLRSQANANPPTPVTCWVEIVPDEETQRIQLEAHEVATLLGKNVLSTDYSPSEITLSYYCDPSLRNDVTEATLNAMLVPLRSAMLSWKLSLSINGKGSNVIGNKGRALSGPLNVVSGMRIKSLVQNTDADGFGYSLYAHKYAAGVWQSRTKLQYGEEMLVPAGIDTVRFDIGYASSDKKTITKEQISDTFDVKIGEWPEGLRNLPIPRLVAIGASTTSGTIKDYGDEPGDESSHDPTIYPWPEYTASVLNMGCINLGWGTTGFLYRGSSGNRENFMDRVYNNADAMEKASVVVIHFGYGNDYAKGDAAYSLPIGSYTDYYPYDEEGYHPTGNGKADLTTMINKGVTLMGALNWIIKWISEHYPHAQIIPIYGSPSANEDRTITPVPHTEGPGTAPYTLTFANPYQTSNDTTHDGRVKRISEELAKLREAMNIPIIDMSFGGAAFNYWQTYATETYEDNGVTYSRYALFSTTGVPTTPPDNPPTSPEWNPHPNDAGYLRYAREIAGRVAALYQYKF